MNERESSSSAPESLPRRRYHFHTPGVLYIIVTLFLAIGALNSQNNLLFATLGLAMGGLLVSGMLSGGLLMGVRIHRSVRGRVHVGDQLQIVYRVENRNRLLPAFGLTLIELGKRQSGDESDWEGRIDRPLGFIAFIPAKGEAMAEVRARARRRGRVELGSCRAWTTFPFGLAKKSVTMFCPATTVVHPVALPVRRGVLQRLSVRALSGAGAAVEPGMGDELYGIREYSDGDNPRLIAWRRSARTGQLVVRQNTTPSPRVVWVVLLVGGKHSRERTEKAIALASALVHSCAAEGATVGLAVPGHDVLFAPRNSPRAIRLMMDQLAELAVRPDVARDFPVAAVRGAANVVIHAGSPDRSQGTARSSHISVDDMDHLLVPGPGLERAMGLLSERPAEVTPKGRPARRNRQSAEDAA